MYDRHYGAKYDPTLSNKEIAARIRSDIKAAVKAGDLPADWKYSVRYHSYSMGSSIHVTATSPRPLHLMEPGYFAAAPDKDRLVRVPLNGQLVPMLVRAGDIYCIHHRDSLVAEAARVDEVLTAIHGAYNHDGSETQFDYFDVKYYGVVHLATAPGVPLYAKPCPSYYPARTMAAAR